LNLEHIFVQAELAGVFVGLIAGAGVDVDLKGHARILFHPVETFCEESPFADSERRSWVRPNDIDCEVKEVTK